jgi:hypothetical protein
MDVVRLLESQVKLEHLQEAAAALPDGQAADFLRAQLDQIQHAIVQAERIVAVAGLAAKPMPWWRDWQDSGAHEAPTKR